MPIKLSPETSQIVRKVLANRANRLEEANNAPRCMQVKVNGTRCGSPAMRGKPFCYFHHRFHCPPLDGGFPALEDGSAIQWAIMQVLDKLLNQKIDPKHAATLFYGLQTASANLKHAEFRPYPGDVVLEDPVTQAMNPRKPVRGEQVPRPNGTDGE